MIALIIFLSVFLVSLNSFADAVTVPSTEYPTLADAVFAAGDNEIDVIQVCENLTITQEF